ncbi:MAG TPA: histidine kinase, partial [Candidatus Dormibacteraeota bacterium]|nr:histidine kinase [Candidatus Dormibacteraeota bacterium]
DRLVKFVDNEYLRMALRGGVIGVGLLLLMLTSIAATGWRQRHSSDPLTQAIGAMAFAYALVLAVMGSTAEYLTYAGVSQLFWMVAGVLGASVLPAAARRLAATPVAPSLPEAERNAEAAIVAPGADVEAVAARADPAVASVADIEVTVTPTASAPKAAPEPGVQQAPVALLQRPTGARPDDGLLTEYGELLNRLLAGTAGDSAYLRILRPRVIEVAATTGSGAPFRETLRLPRPPGRPRLITSTATGGGWPAWCRARGITSAAIAPVLQGSWAVGTMVLASTGAARLSQVDLSGLALGAWMAAQAFESDQRMASLSKQLTEVQPRLKLIAALARASETGMNFPDLATAIGSSVEATYCRLASLDGSGRFQIHATAGSRPPATARGRRPSIASLPSCAEAVRTGRPVVRHFKPGSIEVERRALFSPTTLTGIIVPFFAGPDADGVLLIGEERARAQHLLPDRLGVFQQVAHDLGEVLMLAHTIEQRRVDRLEREKHVIKLNERRELARELHDDVGQALTGLLLQVRLAIEEKRADPADLRIFESAAENALEAARALSNELRRRSHGDPIDAAKRALEKLLASNGTRLTWTDVRSREALSPEV